MKENLIIQNVTDTTLLVEQKNPPFYFSCCNGLILLPREGRNRNSIVIDINIEPEYIDILNKKYGPVSNYICTHGHMDHIAHVHKWESLGVKVHAPFPESKNLLSKEDFYNGFEFSKKLQFPDIEQFADKNKFHPCKEVEHFDPGKTFTFENAVIETVSLSGHSKSHIGVIIPEEKILHVSCMGHDQRKPGGNGFGPWYGFEECSLNQYRRDIDTVENLFKQQEGYLTSSHGYIAKYPDMGPFQFMRDKFESNKIKVKKCLESMGKPVGKEEAIQYCLGEDIFFPKKKMTGFLLNIYTLWEYWIISHHYDEINGQQKKILALKTGP